MKKVQIKEFNLRQIKDYALELYKSGSLKNRYDHNDFLAECYLIAITSELYRSGKTDFVAVLDEFTELESIDD